MEHRRRAADFSHLLETSGNNTTGCGSALESITQEPNSSAQVNNVASENSKSCKRNESSDSGSFKSTILAGQVAGSDSRTTSGSSYHTAQTASMAGGATSRDTSLDSCLRLDVPSVMNRTIITKFTPQAELDLSQTTAGPRSSGEMNKNIVSHSEKSSAESRDTNYNITGDVDSKFTTEDQVPQRSKHKLRPSSPRLCSVERKDTQSLLTKFDNTLASSAVKPKRDEKNLRRLSQEFLYPPRTFTERLVTIIDESETGCVAGADTSAVNLSRMTKEFRKMCKLIQDESMPAMAPSFCSNFVLGTPRHTNNDIVDDYERPEKIVKSPSVPLVGNANKIYRKTPLNIFKAANRNNIRVLSPGSLNSTRDFEYWEKHCEGFSNSPKLPAKNQSKQPLRRSFSLCDISDEAKEVLIKCEEQLRPLEDLTTAEYETFDSHRGHEQKTKAPSPTIHNAFTRDESKANTFYAQSEEIELSSSLLIEKELQRRRCFELATLMQEIEEEAKQSNEEYPKALERHGIDPYTAFIKTISTCLDYKNCLSGIRQNGNTIRKEVSSDTRSCGQTLYVSSKKSFNDASAKNFDKQTRDYAVTCKNPKSRAACWLHTKSAVLGIEAKNEIDKKAASSNNVNQEMRVKSDKKSPSVSPRRAGAYLRPGTKSFVHSKSPPRGKRSPTLQISSKTRLYKTPERSRQQEIGVKSRVPIILPPIPSTSHQDNCPKPKYLSDGIHCASPLTNRTKSSSSRRLASSSKPSPTLRNSSRELIEKISDPESPNKGLASPKRSESPKKKIFVTPGRTAPVGRKRKTKTYFPSMDEHIYPESSQRIMKSLHAPGLYRLGYESVISPISMYIHGTDIELIHNNREKKNDMILTPSKDKASEAKLKFKLTPSRNGPLTNCRFMSDNKDSESDNDENIEEAEVALPKANYNQPTQVHTVIDNSNRICSPRTRGLLESMQNRVVIRHEAKRYGKCEDSVPESCESNSPTDTDMSIHVPKSAQKTNFIGRRRMLS